jgi:hypothetical protein
MRKSPLVFFENLSWNRIQIKIDGFVKSPSAALRFTFIVAAYFFSTPHSSRFARLAYEAFYFTIPIMTFQEIVKIGLTGFPFTDGYP